MNSTPIASKHHIGRAVPPAGVIIAFSTGLLCLLLWFPMMVVHTVQYHLSWTPLVFGVAVLEIVILARLVDGSRLAWRWVRWLSLIAGTYLAVLWVRTIWFGLLRDMVTQLETAGDLGGLDELGGFILTFFMMIALAVVCACFVLGHYVIYFSLGGDTARRYYGLECPRCHRFTSKCNDLLFRDARCRNCDHVW